MSEDEFWQLVDRAAAEGGEDLDERASALFRQLSTLSAEGIVEFESWVTNLSFAAYRTDLWTAAHLVFSGCSGDCFLDFRYWLISCGRAAYYDCLRDPDRLDHWIGREEPVFEELYGIIRRAFHEKSGHELPSRLPPGVKRPEAPLGAPVDLSEQSVRKRFPKLHARLRAAGSWPDEWGP